ncbi:hypothetical protein GH714_007946 [Hevea brasiliensis]|uniref:tRNA pseudouridine synthase n=1 Tax=Hevea brasiliensis TaxID=3981 RepID=A0A6A6M9H2_HEVBR|nr:hypothetical protein GH714_007946 [Hevea brasiliensis]
MMKYGILSVSSSLHPSLSVSSSNNISDVGNGGTDEAIQTVKHSAVDGFKWRLVIAYDGTRYAGKSMIHYVVDEVGVLVSCRDLCYFYLKIPYVWRLELLSQRSPPPDVRVREISPAVLEFHARFSAKSKVYHYKIYNETIMDPFQRQYAYHIAYKLNVDAMRQAAKHFVGMHDFSAFANASRNDRVPDPVKTIFRFDVIEKGALLQLEVEGTGFLYRQVRNMVALLLQIGKEAIPPEIVPKILETRDRKELAKYTLPSPPHGLSLVAVNYNEEHLGLPSGCPRISFGRHRSVSKCKLPLY